MMVTLDAKLLDVASVLGMYVIDMDTETVKMAVMNKIVVRSKLMKYSKQVTIKYVFNLRGYVFAYVCEAC